MDGYSSGTFVAKRLARPTRTAIRKRMTCRPYLVLLPVGLAVPLLLPGTRCALTAPFQPCRGFRPVGGFISVALSLGSPPADVIRHRVSVEPGLSSSSPCGKPAAIRPSDTLELRHSRPASNAKREPGNHRWREKSLHRSGPLPEKSKRIFRPSLKGRVEAPKAPPESRHIHRPIRLSVRSGGNGVGRR